MAVALLFAGCATIDRGGDTAALQQVMAASHRAALVVLTKMNQEELPYRIDDGVNRSTFTKDDLGTLAPRDIDAWDRILCSLDDYCAALNTVASGDHPEELVEACGALGANMQSLAKAANLGAGSSAAGAETALTEIGSILLRVKAGVDVRQVARDADPAFQSVIHDLTGALGFAGEPPAPAPHGILATYENDFQTHNAPRAKAFKDGAIAGFAQMDPTAKRESIQALIRWLGDQRDHDEFVGSIHDLVGALHQAALAHQALASGSDDSRAQAFARLKAELGNVQAIYRKLTQG